VNDNHSIITMPRELSLISKNSHGQFNCVGISGPTIIMGVRRQRENGVRCSPRRMQKFQKKEEKLEVREDDEVSRRTNEGLLSQNEQ